MQVRGGRECLAGVTMPWVPPLQPLRIKPTAHTAEVFQLLEHFQLASAGLEQGCAWNLKVSRLRASWTGTPEPC